MIYHPLLDSFLIVVQTGSFNKAAELCFITPTAVMRKMNQLEQIMGCHLLYRTRQGIRLTKEGRLLYEQALKLKELNNEFMKMLMNEKQEKEYEIRIGSSDLDSASKMMDIWAPLASTYPEYQLRIVPFVDNREDPYYVMKSLNNKFDLFLGCYTNDDYKTKLRFYELCQVPFTLAMSQYHPLAKKSIIEIGDLKGQTIMIGDLPNEYIDAVKNYLALYDDIHIQLVPSHYDMDTFNACASSDRLLLSLYYWDKMHPGLVNKSVDWSFCNRLLMLYHPQCALEVKKFVQCIEDYYTAQGGYSLTNHVFTK